MLNLVKLFLSLLTLAALFWAAQQGYTLLRTEQLVLQQDTQSLLILIAILALVCIFMLSAAIRGGARLIAKAQQMQYKLDVYEKFIALWTVLHKEGNTEQKSNMELEMEHLKIRLSLHASQPVLKAINDLSEGNAQPAFEKVLLAMRTDLGHTNYFTMKQELKKLFSL